jgi:hypothetical protein
MSSVAEQSWMEISIAIAGLAALNGLGDIRSGEFAVERSFTTTTVDNLRDHFPDYNIMVAHGTSFRQTFQNSAHNHYELAVTPPRTKGYEIYVFKSGEFWLNGDGGYENYCYSGTYDIDPKDGGHITFYDPSRWLP